MCLRSAYIDRHKTAIRRNDHSLPVKCLLHDNLISVLTTVFDYGCGYGESIELLRKDNITCNGWDPAFFPDKPLVAADVVNLGYVVNVIENPNERAEAVRRAWELTRKVLAISAQIQVKGRGNSSVEFGDGVVTRLGTFQKYFTQAELREYIETELETEAFPAAPGVFYVFRDQHLREQFLAARYRRRSSFPHLRISEIRFKEHQDALQPLMDWVADRGRLPQPKELPGVKALVDEFGSLKRAFALVRRVTGSELWEQAAERRRQDIIVYLALSRFRKRPKFSELPTEIQLDIRSLFGSYKRGCELADVLLFRSGEAEAIDRACQKTSVGKLLPTALYIHRTALDELEPLLRVYEGCAKTYIGDIESANIIKLHRYSGKISYLSYPYFEKDPHPTLFHSIKVNLRHLNIDCYDYSKSDNPPILHRKESFLARDHKLYERFARLTRQEEKHGLLDDTAAIGTLKGWEERLENCGYYLRGHRLVMRQDYSKGPNM